jgi:hypothetical protein
MMSPKLLLAFMVFFVVSLVGAIPKPHVGMVDTADLRDVGVIYTKANYEGEPKFIYHIKAKPECMALYALHLSDWHAFTNAQQGSRCPVHQDMQD